LVAYLEDLCNSGFMTGDQLSVKESIKVSTADPTFEDHIRSLPTPHPNALTLGGTVTVRKELQCG